MMPWLAILGVAIGLILAFEIYAFMRDKETLSAFVYRVSHDYLIVPFGVGLVVGGLAVHFWLPWCPS